MIKWIRDLMKGYELTEDYNLLVTDTITGEKYSLAGLCAQLTRYVETLEERIKKLEEENIETSNILYELMNSIDAVDHRIDILAENPWKEQFDV